MVELGIHRGAVVALTVTQVHSEHVLHHLVRLPEGQELVNHDGSQEDFNEATNIVIDLVPAEGIIEEAAVTEPTNYTKLSKKITRQSR
jgi:predicted NAD/FAD-binding protein